MPRPQSESETAYQRGVADGRRNERFDMARRYMRTSSQRRREGVGFLPHEEQIILDLVHDEIPLREIARNLSVRRESIRAVVQRIQESQSSGTYVSVRSRRIQAEGEDRREEEHGEGEDDG